MIGHLLRVVIVVLLLIGAAHVANAAKPQSGGLVVSVRLRAGYGLSTTPRPGWVPVRFRGRTWWATPADLIPQPCIVTFDRICLLDPRDGAWVK